MNGRSERPLAGDLWLHPHHQFQQPVFTQLLRAGALRRPKSLLGPMSVILPLFVSIAQASPTSTTDLRGRAVYVDDGDTVVLLTQGHEKVKVRLASIDAPESAHTQHEKGRVGQPFSSNSRDYLESLIKGRDVDARCFDTDRYGRRVCDLFVDQRSVNAAMVKAGLAWANQANGGRYLRDHSLLALEAAARSARIGLWAGSRPVPPWTWRRSCWEQGDCPN